MVWKEAERCAVNIWFRTMFETWPVMELQLKFFSIDLDMDTSNRGPGQYKLQMLFTVVTSLVFYGLSLGLNYAELIKLYGLREELETWTGNNPSLTENLTRARNFLVRGGIGLVFASIGFLDCLRRLVSILFQ